MRVERRTVLAQAAVMGALLVGVAGLGEWSARRAASARRWVMHTIEVEGAIDRAEDGVREAESAARAFALTGLERFATEARAGGEKALSALGRVRQLTADNAAQLERAGRLEGVVRERLDAVEAVVRARLEAGPEGAAAEVESLRGADLARRVADEARGMHAAEQVLLAERTAGAESAAAWTRLSAVGASALGMVAVLLGGRFMLRAAAARARAERGVRAANAELARANAELEAFSYSVSHDLRAPLRAIDGFSRAVEEDHGRDLPPAAREDLARVRAAAGRMGRLIDDLLRLSKVGRQEMRRVEVDVSALAAGVAAELRRAEPGRSVEVVVHEGLRARADPGLVGVILQNLIGNAWKFTGGTPGARIEVGAEDPEREGVRRGGGHGGDGRAFYVRDNGAGFDPAYAERLFTPFRRLHRAEDFPGTGIGLATVRRAVQRQGGEVWAEGSPGRGATFWFTLGRRHDAPEEVTRDEGEDRAAGG